MDPNVLLKYSLEYSILQNYKTGGSNNIYMKTHTVCFCPFSPLPRYQKQLVSGSGWKSKLRYKKIRAEILRMLLAVQI